MTALLWKLVVIIVRIENIMILILNAKPIFVSELPLPPLPDCLQVEAIITQTGSQQSAVHLIMDRKTRRHRRTFNIIITRYEPHSVAIMSNVTSMALVGVKWWVSRQPYPLSGCPANGNGQCDPVCQPVTTLLLTSFLMTKWFLASLKGS